MAAANPDAHSDQAVCRRNQERPPQRPVYAVADAPRESVVRAPKPRRFSPRRRAGRPTPCSPSRPRPRRRRRLRRTPAVSSWRRRRFSPSPPWRKRRPPRRGNPWSSLAKLQSSAGNRRPPWPNRSPSGYSRRRWSSPLRRWSAEFQTLRLQTLRLRPRRRLTTSQPRSLAGARAARCRRVTSAGSGAWAAGRNNASTV